MDPGVDYAELIEELVVIIKDMRGDKKWRTILGAHHHRTGPSSEGFEYRGHGKVTLWPAPIIYRGDNTAAFPKEAIEDGMITVVLDTIVAARRSSLPPYLLERIEGTISLLGNNVFFGHGSGGTIAAAFRRSFSGAQSPTLRVNTVGACETTPARLPLAGDAKSCGRPLDWSF